MDKGHDATPFKLSEARKKGQIAKSTELISVFGLFAMLILLISNLDDMVVLIASTTTWWLESTYKFSDNSYNFWIFFLKYTSDLSNILLSIVIFGVLSTIVGSFVHIGPVFSTFSLQPDFSRLNPAAGFKKIFSIRALVDLIRLIIKIIVFSLVFFLVIDNNKADLFTPNHTSINYLIMNLKSIFLNLVYAAFGVFLIFAIFDVWFSKRSFSKQMRMSNKDVKDEMKRHEGDPLIKAKRKRMLAELLRNSASIKNVKDSDVIITNPTHVAVALKYRPKSMAVPIVVAKGKGLLAESIKYQARKHRIPIIRKPALARALLKKVNVSQPIPNDLQVNVASVYRWVVSIPGSKVFSV